MVKILKSKLVVGAVCIVLAALISFVLLPWIYSSKSETTTVIKVMEDIPAGTLISAAMLTEATVGSYGLPSSVSADAAEAIGMVASETLYAGEYLSRNRLITEQEYQKLVEAQTKGL
ncbi:MAG: SAF domain-containing protein, partial [Oscillospiraceae bacterium]|nr:SAF domain-containing protein [Oscillospiraceae bacterium]